MTISQKALDSLTMRAKLRLALELGCSSHTIQRRIAANEKNGDLTKTMAVRIISEETGIPEDEVLEGVTIS